MCGFAGFLPARRTSASESVAIVRRMAQRLVHRGPDDSGEWVAESCEIALGHRRLSVLDLSPAGHQPMVSASGRFVIAFNGEIYNYRELRRELEALGITGWRGTSDTEVMLSAMEQWGVEETLPRLNGMFAFALWDRESRQLVLARDRFGEKPLYYAKSKGTFLFGSELGALAAHRDWGGELNRAAFNQFMRLKYVDGPATIYKDCWKLPPASSLTVGLDASGALSIGVPRTYWSAVAAAQLARADQFKNLHQAKEEFEQVFSNAVNLRVRSDVPLGAFLSGGIDSSLIVAAMRDAAMNPIKTFTIGYEDADHDESAAAKAIAAHLGTEHRSIFVSAGEVGKAIALMPSMFDEPFADTSQIPTYLVSRAAREHVTVALTGDGGDELFGGYHRYFVGQRTWLAMSKLPLGLRRVIARILRTVPPHRWDSVIDFVAKVPGVSGRLQGYSGHRLHSLGTVLPAKSAGDMYASLMVGPHANHELLYKAGLLESAELAGCWSLDISVAEAMMLADTQTILPDDFLVKVDRASMSVSLETRAPFLDPKLFDFAWRLPLDWKIDGRQGKVFLRKVLADRLPAELIDPRKRGFGLPLDRWLQGELRGWAESLIYDQGLETDGLINPAAVRTAWTRYLSGERHRFSGIWSILVFRAWYSSRRAV